jgi:hypothetical protein
MNNNISVIMDESEPNAYTVKYIGVVDGSMGILSRKMRMPKYTEASVYDKREFNGGTGSDDDPTKAKGHYYELPFESNGNEELFKNQKLRDNDQYGFI